MPKGFDPRQPILGPLLCGGRMPPAVDIKAAMGAGSDAGIFLGAPVNEVMPAFAAGTRVI